MFELIIEKLKYIKGVPIELTDKAVLNGLLKKGAIVGIIGHCWERSEQSVLMEVRLTSNMHAGLINPGNALNLHGQGDVYWIDVQQMPIVKPPSKSMHTGGQIPEKSEPRPGFV